MFNLIKRASYTFANIKHLSTTAVSTPNGIRVTYANVQNKTHDIDNPLETFISCLAACETSVLRIVADKKKIKLGEIKWTKIDSNYDLSNLQKGGPSNRIGDISLEVEIEAKLTEK